MKLNQMLAILAGAILAAMPGLSTPAHAQEGGRVIGQVIESGSGAPLSQVQVYLEGTGLGTLTRQDGRFIILNVPAGTYEVRAERIGLEAGAQQVTLAAGDAAQVTFQLQTQTLGLDEIVVTGTAGAARRREIGNSIAELNPAEIPGEPLTATAMLQAAAPGISVTGGSASAGMGKVIRLRGNKSVAMTNQPLIYIDGIRVMSEGVPAAGTPGEAGGGGSHLSVSPLDMVNPNDIARIEVIKGSAATTLYGTEAAAGVIQIFTKRGSAGAPIWTAEITQGTGWMQEFGANGVGYLHMEHFLRDAWWGGGYEGGDLSRDCVTDDARWQGVNDDPEGACSWPGSMWLQNYSLSVRGGGEALQYFMSGSFQNDAYILPLDSLKDYSVRGNFVMTPMEDLQVQWNTSYTNRWQRNTAEGNNLSAVTLQSFRQDENYVGSADPRVIAQVLDLKAQYWIERLTTGASITHTGVPNLTTRFTIGYDFLQQESRNLQHFGYWVFPEGSVTNNVYENRLLTFDYVSTYNFDITGELRSNLSWGGQAVGDDEREVTALGQNFPGAVEPTVSSGSIREAFEDRQKAWNAGFFVQNVLDFRNRYFLTAGLRVDGNSAFGEDFGLQSYPKLSAAWVVSDENFWPGDLGSLKLRAAYGQSGRAPGAFDAVRTWDPVGFIDDPAFQPDNLGNPDLGPEVTSEFEAGFDGSFLDDRLGVIFTYYDQTTSDALMQVSSIPSQGFTGSQLKNVGKISNQGIELQIDARPIATADWGVDLGLGIATNKSEVLDLGGNPDFSEIGGRIMEGQPVPVAWDRRVQNPDEIGPFVYSDCEGVTFPDCAGENEVIGPLLPTTFVTPRLTVRVPGNIQLSALGEYQGGHYREISPIAVDRGVRSPLCYPYYVNPLESTELKDGISAIWRERCTPDGADDYWFAGDNFKLRTVSATAPVNFAFPDNVTNATLTLSLNNAWKWYREIPWYEVAVSGDNPVRSEDVGGQTERTPAPATFLISLRVTF